MLRPNRRSPVIVPVLLGEPAAAVTVAVAVPGVALSVPRGNFWRKLLGSIAVVIMREASVELILLAWYMLST